MKRFAKLILVVILTFSMCLGTLNTFAPTIAVAKETTEEDTMATKDYVQQLIWYYANGHTVDVQRTLENFERFSKKNHTTDAEQWKKIMDYWQGVDNEDPAYYTESYDTENTGANIPAGLPDDNSLCIVILGFRLKPDGSMEDELKGRCDAAVQLAKKYPHAYIACTGGGTAMSNPNVTEADSMKAYITQKYGSEIGDKIIVENKSKTTVQNAQFTYAILGKDYPEVKHLAMVTSQYHLKRGCLLYYTQMLLKAYEAGNTPIDIVGTYGWYRADLTFEGISMEARSLASLAGVSIVGPSLSFDKSVPTALDEVVVDRTNLVYGEDVKVIKATAHYAFDGQPIHIKQDVTNKVTVTYDPTILGPQQVIISYCEGDITVTAKIMINIKLEKAS